MHYDLPSILESGNNLSWNWIGWKGSLRRVIIVWVHTSGHMTGSYNQVNQSMIFRSILQSTRHHLRRSTRKSGGETAARQNISHTVIGSRWKSIQLVNIFSKCRINMANI